MDEFNKQQTSSNEIPKAEYSSVGQTEPIQEYGSLKKAKTVSKVTSIAITVIGATLVLGSFLTFVISSNKGTTEIAKFELAPSAHEIAYEIEITKSKSDELKLKLHSQFVDRTINISIGETTGSFAGLTPNMKYEISILEKNTVVVSKSITTYSEGE